MCCYLVAEDGEGPHDWQQPGDWAQEHEAKGGQGGTCIRSNTALLDHGGTGWV